MTRPDNGEKKNYQQPQHGSTTLSFLILSTLALLILRAHVIGFKPPTFSKADNPAAASEVWHLLISKKFSLKKIQLRSVYSVYWDLFCISTFQSLLTRALTFLYLPSFNLGLLLAPTQLSFDWSMGAIPLLEALSDIRLWVALASYSVLLLIFVKGCLKNVIEKGSYSFARGK